MHFLCCVCLCKHMVRCCGWNWYKIRISYYGYFNALRVPQILPCIIIIKLIIKLIINSTIHQIHSQCSSSKYVWFCKYTNTHIHAEIHTHIQNTNKCENSKLHDRNKFNAHLVISFIKHFTAAVNAVMFYEIDNFPAVSWTSPPSDEITTQCLQ